MTAMRGLGVLLWKHARVRYRRWILSSLELLGAVVPLALLLLLVLMTDMHHTVETFHSSPGIPLTPNTLLWAPASSPFLEDVMIRAAHKLNLPSDDLMGFASEEALLAEKMGELEEDYRINAVIFENASSTGEPETLAYRVRSSNYFDTSRTSPLIPFPGHNSYYDQDYYRFVSVQMAIDLAFIEKKSGKVVDTILNFQEFPYPAYEEDGLLWAMFSILLPLAAVVGTMLLMVSTVVRLVTEKASGIKELMKMMGVGSNLLWTSHYINCILLQLLAIAIQICLLKLGPTPLAPASDVLILIISLFLYINYVILFAFVFSSFFSRPLVASVLASVAWVVTMIVAMIPGLTNSTAATLAISFLPNMPIFWMYQVIGIQEMVGKGVMWDGLLFQPQESILSVGLVWVLIVCHCLLYWLLAWYMEKVHPGPYGVPHPHGFFFTKKYWQPNKVSSGLEEENRDPSEQPDPAYFESLGQNAEVGVDIQNLWKVYGGWGQVRKTALAGVTMQVLRGGITVLLGHNGAGKTTLMSIITGMYQATRGTVTLGDQSQAGAPHHSMGLCPQHNLTFPDLTLQEHLIFFGMIKGINYKNALKESVEVLGRLQLDSKADWLCGTLSGGQRRRAQLAMALVGRPALLVLDEPTTGLDPQSRRQLWDILLEIRDKHTILITTHFMEEADILGDRVAILDHGQLRCYGTPMFLKKVFGTGYTLSILLEGHSQDERSVEKVEQLVGEHVTAERLTEGGSEADLRWRLQPAPAPALPALFRALEHQRDTLHISSMGLSLTTLEEVFLRVTEGVLDDGTQRAAEEISGDCDRYLSGAALLLSRLWALVIKKLLYFNSVKISVILQLLLACVMFLVPLLPLGGSSGNGSAISPSLLLAPPPHQRPLRLPYFTNGTAPPEQLNHLADVFGMTLEHTEKDVYDMILEEGEKHPLEGYRGSLVLALSFNPEEWRVLYSTSVYHGMPAATALLTNLLAMELLPATSTVRLSPSCHPLPHKAYVVQTGPQDGKGSITIIYWASCVTISCFLLVAIFLPYTILERVTWSGGLVSLAGGSPFLRWTALLLTDLLLICVPISTILVILTCVLDPDKTFSLSDTAGPLLVLLWFHFLASLSFVYSLSITMKQPAAAYIVYLLITLFLGVQMSQIVVISSEMEGGKPIWASILDVAGSLVVPTYTLCHGLVTLGRVASYNAQCLAASDHLCCGTNEATGECVELLNYFSFDEKGISPHILYICASFTLYTVILIMYEYGLWQRPWEYCTTLDFKSPQLWYNDSDVNNERKVVQDEVDSGNKGQSRVLLHRLAKRYTRGHTAVKEFSISLKKGECFGLLGANGAGKSTIFGMVVGAQVPTRGSVYHGELGYCPQFEALDGYLTGRQILTLFCLLRGEPPSLVPPRVEAMLCSAGLKEYADMANRKYSGGNRRKLSTLVALSGGGQNGNGAVLLDEPSAGVDPHSRLALHKLIQMARLRGLSILLSSHSMEECEKLVSRLGILNFGELTCLGPVQSLKERYGSGFLLSLRLRTHPLSVATDPAIDSSTPTAVDLVEHLKFSIHEAFPCHLKDQHLTILQFHISDRECPYSELFSRMEVIRERHTNILEDYTISNTTLEQVFLSFNTGYTPTQANGIA